MSSIARIERPFYTPPRFYLRRVCLRDAANAMQHAFIYIMHTDRGNVNQILI